MGETSFDFADRGYQSGLSLNFPYCVGGIMRGEKEGYKEAWERVTAADGVETELHLVPLLSYPVDRIKVVKHDATGENVGPAIALSDDELALIRLTAYKKGKKFHEIEQVIGGSLDEEIAARMEADFLAQADFEYEVEVNVFDGEKVIGGYSANWTVPWDGLQNAEEIVFHTVTRDGADDVAIFDLISNLGTYSAQVPQPEFILQRGMVAVE